MANWITPYRILFQLQLRNTSLPSLHDLDLFNLSDASNNNIDPDLNINQKFRCQYFSPHSFHVFTTGFSSTPNIDATFSLFHNNVRSLERNPTVG